MTVKDLLDLFKKWEYDNIDEIYLPCIHLFSDGSGKITNDEIEIHFHTIDELIAILKRAAFELAERGES